MDRRHNAKVLLFLEKKGVDGATITEIIDAVKLTRDNVRIAVAALEGAESIVLRKVGKAKLYRISENYEGGEDEN